MSKRTILEKLRQSPLIGDGGTIFELERRGYISAGPFTPQAVLEHPEAVIQLQTDFALAGAEVLQACTYYAHEEKLKVVGLTSAFKEINAQARCSNERPYFQIQEFEGKIAFPLALDPFVLTRNEMAAYAIEAQKIGINYIGSCCGAAPHHIRSMSEALGRTVPASRYSPELALHTIIGDSSHVKEKDSRILCEQRYGKSHCHFMEKQ